MWEDLRSFGRYAIGDKMRKVKGKVVKEGFPQVSDGNNGWRVVLFTEVENTGAKRQTWHGKARIPWQAGYV